MAAFSQKGGGLCCFNFTKSTLLMTICQKKKLTKSLHFPSKKLINEKMKACQRCTFIQINEKKASLIIFRQGHYIGIIDVLYKGVMCHLKQG